MPRQMPTTLRPRFRAQARGGSLLHHAPNRRPRFPRSTPPPGPSAHPSGFSIRSQQDSIGFNPTAHQRLPFVPPLPRSSIPGSATMIPQTYSHRLSEIRLGGSPIFSWLASRPRAERDFHHAASGLRGKKVSPHLNDLRYNSEVLTQTREATPCMIPQSRRNC